MLIINALSGIESGIELFPVAPNAMVFINSTPVSFCTLSQYIGSYATASAVAEGGLRTVGRVDVLVRPPAYDPYNVGYPYYGPFVVGIPANPMFNPGGMGRR